MSKEQEQLKMCDYLLRHLEKTLTSGEEKKLKQYLENDPDGLDLYIGISNLYAQLSTPNRLNLRNKETETDMSAVYMSLLEKLGDEEKSAETIEIPEEKLPRELIQKVVYPPHKKRKPSKFNIVFAAMSAAAMLFFFLFLEFAPPKSGKVAALTDSLNAKWMDLEKEMVKGASITTSEKSLFLHEGYIELLFDNQAKVTIEGPAEFKIPADDQIKLNYGRLYVTVPREAIGFTVKTPSSQIVDLGTEFGVDCGLHSDTSLHVIKGKTVLIAGGKSNKVSIEVKAGDAKKVLAQTISDIPCNERLFVREIDSASNLIWRGENELSLADIVAGGDGFSVPHSLVGIDPATSEYTSTIVGGVRGSEKEYCPVVASKFIDGVFVPDGNQDGTIAVTSLGHTFECPDTGGNFTFGIIACEGNILKRHPNVPPAVIKGQKYENNSLLMLHSNAGITFDLQAIRQSLPGFHLESFKASGGLTEAQNNTKEQPPDVDFWILVDGKIRYEKKAFMLEDGLVPFDVKLGSQDHFLTLIITDGSRPDEPKRGYNAHSNDFFYLIDPKLSLTE